MLSRATLYSSPGGDTIQIESTAKYLRKKGIQVDIRLANESSIDYSSYALLHLFNAIRPNDFLYHISESAKPFLLSTIYVDYSAYERENRRGVFGLVTRMFDKYTVEYFKTIARAVLNSEKIVSPSYYFLGQKKSMRQLIRKSACLLPNSHSEMKRVEEDLKVTNHYQVIPNAIDKEKFKTENNAGKRAGVICVARIEGRKNQLNLIKAMEGLDFNLTVIGKCSPNHTAYYNECKAAAGANVSFVDHIDQDQLKHIYANAKVHILPSWFETTGLSSLEAAYMGCNIVVTAKGDTEEYFGDHAVYCEPGSIDSIRTALVKAYGRPSPDALIRRIEENFTWEITAEKTLNAYRQVLEKTKNE